MITVHHLNNSRSQRILWLLEELGLDYEIAPYQRDAVTRLAPPELKAVHPLGKSPVVEAEGLRLAESGAIVEYLIERHGQGRLGPPPGAPGRADYLHWLHFAEGSAMLSKSWASGGTGMRADEETANAKYWASLAHAAAGGGVLTFCGRTGAVSPESGDYTAEQVGASPVGHIHTAADLTGGTLGGAVVAHSGAQQDLTLMQVRNISAGTADLTAGESELAEGQIYLVYEEV